MHPAAGAATVTAMGRLLLLLAVLGVTTLAVTTGPAAALTGEASCRPDEVRQHNEVVFGHFSTLAEAKTLKARAAALGFQGLKVENDGCGDFELEIDGADRVADRVSFAAEAAKAGFAITFEQTAPPMEYRQGQVVGVLGSQRTLKAANALAWQLAKLNFRYIDIARVGKRWLVVMPQVPIKHALDIAHEVASAGYHIQFRPGVKP
jgi:hypothetical protein